MGGFGSGRSSYGSLKDFTNELPKIVLGHSLNRGLIDHLRRVPVPIIQYGASRYTAYADCERDKLQITCKSNGSLIFSSTLEISRSTCHFGGTRAWFLCPLCDRRVRDIYLCKVDLCCRKCCQLVYPTQYMDKNQRWHYAYINKLNELHALEKDLQSNTPKFIRKIARLQQDVKFLHERSSQGLRSRNRTDLGPKDVSSKNAQKDGDWLALRQLSRVLRRHKKSLDDTNEHLNS